jgi:hypothetical protein
MGKEKKTGMEKMKTIDQKKCAVKKNGRWRRRE